jgi:hypothetical protein
MEAHMHSEVVRIVYSHGPVVIDGVRYVAQLAAGVLTVDLTANATDLIDAMYLVGYKVGRIDGARLARMVPVLGKIK